MKVDNEIEKYMINVRKAQADTGNPTPIARVYNAAYSAVYNARRDALAEYHANKATLGIVKADRDRWKALAELAVELLYQIHPYVEEYYKKKHGYDADYDRIMKLKKEMEAE